jgi:hypothetical protein
MLLLMDMLLSPNCMSVPTVISIYLCKPLHLGDFERGPEYSLHVGFP